MKILLVAIGLIGILLLASSCVSSAYILTNQYINPNSKLTEQITIPVSQYVYDNTKVGDNFQVTVHTMFLGVKVSITDIPNPSIAIADTTPIFMMALSIAYIAFAIYKVFISQNKWKWYTLITPVIIIGFTIYLSFTYGQ